MKLGLTLLILSVMFASAGVGLRSSGTHQEQLAYTTVENQRVLQDKELALHGETQEAAGLGLLGFGGGLLLVGIFTLIIEYRKFKITQ